MDRITVTKASLLAKLHENLTDHQTIFEEACAAWRDVTIHELEDALRQVRGDEKFRTDIRVTRTAPRSHAADYKRAIAMVEMEVGEHIVLSEHDFARYVMDDWEWGREFLRSARFSETANTKFADFYAAE